MPNGTIPARWADIVAKQPETVAALGQETWTYAQFEAFAEGIAGRIVAAAPGTRQDGQRAMPAPVALLLAHDVPLIGAIFGVLKTGHPYLALEPKNPLVNIVSICADAQPGLLLTDKANRELAREIQDMLGADSFNIAFIEDWAGEGEASLAVSEMPIIAGTDTACLFYTSGSTGTPKGVVQSHACLLQEADNYGAFLHLGPGHRLALLTSCSFGASKSVIFGALLNGAAVYPFDLKRDGMTALAVWMRDNAITTLHCVPSLFRRLLETPLPGQVAAKAAFPALSAVKLGGEAATKRDWQLFQTAVAEGRLAPDCRFINGLGMTEAGGNVCFFEMKEGTMLRGETVPIGYPAPGYGIEIQDEDRRPLAPGEIGEIVITGESPSDGYWRQQEATAAVFADVGEGRRSYRTGDLGRLSADGCLEHMGRRDGQVKIRGQRVEITAIEVEILSLPGMRDAAVVAVTPNEGAGNGEIQLVAFFRTSDPDTKVPAIRRHLKNTLPEYMVPVRFKEMKEWPLLPSGKVDRTALKAMAQEENALADFDHVDALTGIFLRIWQKALGNNALRPDDNFFAAGGHSLAAADICAAIHREMNFDIPLAAIGQFPTVYGLAQAFREGRVSNDARVLTLQPNGKRPPFFCIPGAGGDGFSFLEVARNFNNDQPFYALQPPGLNGISRIPRTMKEFADCYIELIRAVQPQGPYYLGGASFGGLVMFEVARELQEQGDEVALLVMIDSRGIGYPAPKKLGLKRPMLWLYHVLPLAKKDSFDLKNIARGAKEHVKLYIAMKEIDKSPRPISRRFMHLRQACFRAKWGYKPPPFRGTIHMLRAEIQPTSRIFKTDNTLGWSGLATEGVRDRVMTGRHGAYLQEPVVHELVGHLEELLLAAQNQGEPNGGQG